MKSRYEVFRSDEEYKAYLRIEFAKAAMQGLLSNAVFMDNVVYDNDQEDARKKIVAHTAIITADELLKQLEHGSK